MTSQSFHAHFFRDETGAWCISVRMPDGSRTVPRALTPVQIYELMPWLEALGISYAHLVDSEQDVELWIAQAFERLESQRARLRSIYCWESAFWWAGVTSIVLSVFLLIVGSAEFAVVMAVAYFPIALGRDACVRAAAHQARLLRPMLSKSGGA